LYNYLGTLLKTIKEFKQCKYRISKKTRKRGTIPKSWSVSIKKDKISTLVEKMILLS